MTSTFKLPTFELPKLPFELPDFSSIELPELPTPEQVADAARDAVHAGLGLAVMAVEQVRDAATKLSELVTSAVEQARSVATN